MSFLKEYHHRRLSKNLQHTSISKHKVFISHQSLLSKHLCHMIIRNVKTSNISFATRFQEIHIKPAGKFSKSVIISEFENMYSVTASQDSRHFFTSFLKLGDRKIYQSNSSKLKSCIVNKKYCFQKLIFSSLLNFKNCNSYLKMKSSHSYDTNISSFPKCIS